MARSLRLGSAFALLAISLLLLTACKKGEGIPALDGSYPLKGSASWSRQFLNNRIPLDSTTFANTTVSGSITFNKGVANELHIVAVATNGQNNTLTETVDIHSQYTTPNTYILGRNGVKDKIAQGYATYILKVNNIETDIYDLPPLPIAGNLVVKAHDQASRIITGTFFFSAFNLLKPNNGTNTDQVIISSSNFTLNY